MLKELVDLIQKTAVEASGAKGKVEFVRPPGEPGHVYVAVSPSGAVTAFESKPKPRNHELRLLDEVPRFVDKKGTIEKTVVWFDRSGIVIIVDDDTRRDTATLGLTFTPQMQKLLEIVENAKEFPQKAFCRLLKIDLYGTFTDLQLLKFAQECTFKSIGNVAGVQQHSRQSMGKDIDQQVTSSAGICPEEITLYVRVFDDPALTECWPVKCAVEIIPESASFRLTPLALELHNAIENEVTAIGERILSEVKCPVFRGVP